MLGGRPAPPRKRTNIINYISGVDAYDEDLDGNLTETRQWVLGDNRAFGARRGALQRDGRASS